MNKSMSTILGRSMRFASKNIQATQQSVRSIFTNNKAEFNPNQMNKIQKHVSQFSRMLSSQIPKSTSPSSSSASAADKHDGIAIFGEEQWNAITEEAAKNTNVMLALREKDLQASGLDINDIPIHGHRVTPQLIHEQFRDLSKMDEETKHASIVDVCTSAATIKYDVPADKLVSNWLYLVALLVFVMVVVGGLTRLTKSGLSMVHWKFTGEKRPSTVAEWETEFARYKDSPEYKLHNQGMTLDEFKFIYHMEFGHRSLGRIIGLVFGLPFITFLITKRISLKTGLGKGLLAALSLGALQGGIGWWMVKSGLTEEDNKVKAKVSPYRLATHLITAFALFSMLSVLAFKFRSGKVSAMIKDIPIKAENFMNTYAPTSLSHALAAMTFFTAASGAFVAGNEAGLVYNEFPLMGGQVIPDDIIDPHIPFHKNFFENSVTVQFIHRCLAISTFSVALFTAYKCHRKLSCFNKIHAAAQHVAVAATFQAGLGISTLLMGVPVNLAACHQAGAMILLFTTLRLMYLSRNPVLSLDGISEQLAQDYKEKTKNQQKTQPENQEVKASMVFLLASIGTIGADSLVEAREVEESQ